MFKNKITLKDINIIYGNILESFALCQKLLNNVPSTDRIAVLSKLESRKISSRFSDVIYFNTSNSQARLEIFGRKDKTFIRCGNGGDFSGETLFRRDLHYVIVDDLNDDEIIRFLNIVQYCQKHHLYVNKMPKLIITINKTVFNKIQSKIRLKHKSINFIDFDNKDVIQ